MAFLLAFLEITPCRWFLWPGTPDPRNQSFRFW